jgi:hypothetical protein
VLLRLVVVGTIVFCGAIHSAACESVNKPKYRDEEHYISKVKHKAHEQEEANAGQPEQQPIIVPAADIQYHGRDCAYRESNQQKTTY